MVDGFGLTAGISALEGSYLVPLCRQPDKAETSVPFGLQSLHLPKSLLSLSLVNGVSGWKGRDLFNRKARPPARDIKEYYFSFHQVYPNNRSCTGGKGQPQTTHWWAKSSSRELESYLDRWYYVSHSCCPSHHRVGSTKQLNELELQQASLLGTLSFLAQK